MYIAEVGMCDYTAAFSLILVEMVLVQGVQAYKMTKRTCNVYISEHGQIVATLVFVLSCDMLSRDQFLMFHS